MLCFSRICALNLHFSYKFFVMFWQWYNIVFTHFAAPKCPKIYQFIQFLNISKQTKQCETVSHKKEHINVRIEKQTL